MNLPDIDTILEGNFWPEAVRVVSAKPVGGCIKEEPFTVVDRSVMSATWGRNIWQEETQLITSMDFAKQGDVMETFFAVQWDLVIVDEAHKMAAYRSGQKTDKTERYRLGEVLSRTSQFLLFLTATPHRGDPENFRLFLELLEPGFFATTDLLDESIHNRDNPLFLRRLIDHSDNHSISPTESFGLSSQRCVPASSPGRQWW